MQLTACFSDREGRDHVRLSPAGRVTRQGERLPWWPVGVVVVVAVIVQFVGSAADGGFTATVTNTADRVQAASLLTAASTGGASECDLGGAGYTPISSSNTAGCTGTLLPSGTAPATGSSSVATLETDKGSVAATGLQLTKGSCGPVQLANTAKVSDPMLVRGNTLTFAQPGPLTGSAALAMSGGSTGTGYAADVTLVAGTNNFTELVWFKANINGTLMGFTNTPAANNPGTWDRMLWLDGNGHVVFGVRPGSTVELTSPAATYLDGKWHLAAGTLSAAGMVLSIDGATVASTTATTTAQAYSGYWHVGWDNENSGWSNPPSTPYFAGALADAGVFPALTAAQVTSLYTAGSQSAWNTRTVADSAINSWPLGDAGSTAYTGAIPSVTPNGCAFIDVTIGAAAVTTSCAAPASSTSCAAPSSTLTLASLATVTTISNLPTPAQPVTVTTTIARDPTNTIAAYPYAAGLHLTTPLALAATNTSFSATLNWPAQSIVL